MAHFGTGQTEAEVFEQRKTAPKGLSKIRFTISYIHWPKMLNENAVITEQQIQNFRLIPQNYFLQALLKLLQPLFRHFHSQRHKWTGPL